MLYIWSMILRFPGFPGKKCGKVGRGPLPRVVFPLIGIGRNRPPIFPHPSRGRKGNIPDI